MLYFLMINCQYPEIYVFYILPLICYHAKYYFFCKTLYMYVPQWQKLYASILKPSVKKHATHMMHTVAILKIVLENVPV